MCTLIILYRPDNEWPVLIGANRDEMLNRPARPPGRHWPDRPHVVAGRDELGGGSWFGVNDDGVAAGVMNRTNTLGPAAGKRSRGELVLEALDHADASSAADALSDIDPDAYRAFNLIVADNQRVYWLRHTEAANPGRVEVVQVEPGLSMLTAHDLNDMSSARIRRYLPFARTAAVPDPDRGDWLAWEALLASRESDPGDFGGAMNIVTNIGFGTVSSTLLALPAANRLGVAPRLRFADGRPDQAPFRDIPL